MHMSLKEQFCDHILNTWRVLCEPGQIVEVRVPNVPNSRGFKETRFGYFDDGEKLANAAWYLDNMQPAPPGIYITVNPINQALLARAANRIITSGRNPTLAKDEDVTRIRWFLIDLDPIRPAGVSATDDEKAAVFRAADSIIEHLHERGWPSPIKGDSGNGAHLLYRTDLEVTPETHSIIARGLQALSARFSNATVKVDTSVGNPSRIWKLYGTTARKGDQIHGRPWRRAKLLSSDPVDVVARRQLEELAAEAPAPKQASTPSGAPESDVDRARKYVATIKGSTQGGRTNAAYKAAAACVRDYRLSDEQALEIVTGWDRVANTPPIEGDPSYPGGIAQIIKNARKHGKHDEGKLVDGQAPAPSKRAQPTLADELLDLARDHVQLWRGDDRAWATVMLDNAHINVPCRSGDFKIWLRNLAMRELGKQIGSETTDKVSQTIESIALFGDVDLPPAPEEDLFIRVGHRDEAIYFDLGDDTWRAVEITREGWRLVARPPVKFRRARGMRPCPVPETGGSLHDLRPLINASDDENWTLALAWLVGAMHPRGPYPILILQGEQGSAKSTTSRLLRDLVDPSKASLRAVPHDPKDIVIAASNSWTLAYDNLSGMADWLSDSLCRISTGGGISNRALYTDNDEIILDVRRPMILNGIDDVAHRADLRDRAVILNLNPIPEQARLEERDVIARYESARPRIMGALFDAVAQALANPVAVPNLPRMADWASWVVSSEPALPVERGHFLTVYREMAANAVEISLEANVIANAIKALMERRPHWQGTAADLLTELNLNTDTRIRESKNWPQDSNRLGGRLKRLATDIRRTGINISFSRQRFDGRVTRWITVHKTTSGVNDSVNDSKSFSDTDLV